MPSNHRARIKDFYELLDMNKEVDTPDRKHLTKDELGYQTRYYFFNNTRYQFPALSFTDADPEVKVGKETFCIHFYYQHQNGLEEKRYGMFEDVDN